MERRMLLAVVLSIVSVTAYSALTGRGCMAPPPKKTDEVPEVLDPPPAKGGDPAQDAPKKDAPKKDDPSGDAPAGDAEPEDLGSHPQANVEPTTVVLVSDQLEVVITSQGGAVRAVRHKDAFESDRKTPFDEIVPIAPTMLFGSTDDTDVTPAEAPGGADRSERPAGPMRMPALQWTRDAQAEQASPENDAIYTFRNPAGIVFTKQWILPKGEGRYDLTLRMSARAADGAPVPEGGAVEIALLASSGHLREYVRGAFANLNTVLYRLSSVKDISDDNHFGLPIQELEQKGRNRARLEVFGVRSAYFLSLYYRVAGEDEPDITHFWATGEDASRRGEYDENLAGYWKTDHGIDLDDHPDVAKRISAGVPDLLHCWLSVKVPVSAETPKPIDLHFYVGPNERNTLRQDAYGPLDSVITYPNAFDLVADALLWIYDIWRALFGSAGLAIILMTVCVRGAMMPLSVRNQLSMRSYGRKVAKLKPKVAELQKKFASNPKKLRDEQMKLYREHGVGFPSGCLMMLVQIPVFFALFSSLRVEYTIRGASFLWIDDLSGPDRLVDFGSRVIDLGFFWVESINVLPILMVILSILHMRSMPKPADEQQAQQMKMMKWLPIFFAFILYNYTAALAIYMVLSSTVAIIESKIVRSRDAAALEESAAAAGS